MFDFEHFYLNLKNSTWKFEHKSCKFMTLLYCDTNINLDYKLSPHTI